jgi:hypothetical protein
LRTAHTQIWRDDEVKNVHYILGKPWNDKDKSKGEEEIHVWWWEMDEERRMKEREAGFTEPQWK